jgi:hypothetical protein
LIMRARVRTILKVTLCVQFCIVFLNARDHAQHCITAVSYAARWCLFLPNPQAESHRLAAASKCNFIYPLLFPHLCGSQHSEHNIPERPETVPYYNWETTPFRVPVIVHAMKRVSAKLQRWALIRPV